MEHDSLAPLADFGPGDALPVQQTDPAVPKRVR